MTRGIFMALALANLALLGWALVDERGEAEPRAPDPGVRSLVMLSEREPPPRASAEAPAPASPLASLTAARDEVCYTLGPFRSADSAGQARRSLQGLDLKPSGRVRNEREQYGYQVFLPPFEDREAAIAAARRLAEQGITEYYIMNEDELRNAISLGLFRDKQHATRFLDGLKKKQVFAEMLPRYRERKLYWLDYADTEERLTNAAIRQLFPEEPVQRLTRSCT